MKLYIVHWWDSPINNGPAPLYLIGREMDLTQYQLMLGRFKASLEGSIEEKRAQLISLMEGEGFVALKVVSTTLYPLFG